MLKVSLDAFGLVPGGDKDSKPTQSGRLFYSFTTRSSEYSLPRSSKMPLLLLEEKDGLKTNQTPERVGHWGTYENHESALGSI